MSILVTGGTGYIGSHTVVQLLEAGEEVIILDNLINSKREVLTHIETISKKKPLFIEGDIRDERVIEKIFRTHVIEAVVHFAGLKAVGESVEQPLEYYENNVVGTISLLKMMKKYNCKKMVFSSSATVYGNNLDVPFVETHSLSTTNAYGATKHMIEEILQDVYTSDDDWSIALLRYFNPIGAHKSGLIGEDPNDIPNNLLPYVAKVATGELTYLRVFGNDYDTKDGTGVRDYIHVDDLASGHLKALKYIEENTGIEAINLGTGIGYSVIDVVNAFQKASQKQIEYTIIERRAGDIAVCYADATKAKVLLNWEAKRDLDEMCEDAWRFASRHQQ